MHEEEDWANTCLGQALDSMKVDRPGPKKLLVQLERAAEDYDDPEELVANVLHRITSDDPNEPVRVRFLSRLHRWDGTNGTAWKPRSSDTNPWTPERRAEIYGRLSLDGSIRIHLDANHPVRVPEIDEPIDLTGDELPEHWYDGREGFYFKAYRERLRDANWPEEGVTSLTDVSRQILQRLDDPTRPSSEARSVRGLVVGYVQSGKTANFIGLIARAIDSGFRLIVVLAGNTNILRQQTQRRLDKELVGTDTLRNSHADSYDYAEDDDWEQFQTYHTPTGKLGRASIERLTGYATDYKELTAGLGVLEFRPHEQMRPFNDRLNLEAAPVRLVVMKKHYGILNKLANDLGRLGQSDLSNVPALIIDDESDQGGVNTHRSLSKDEKDQRTKTNEALCNLLKVLPRSQYIGYTATPFANAFIDPEDPEDLYPRHFMLCLGRPSGYMGVSDFYDLDGDGELLSDDERPDGYRSNQRAYYRSVTEKEDRLQEAIDAWVLSGALKVFRERNVDALSFRHHTMLVHTHHTVARHKEMAHKIKTIWKKSTYTSGRGLERLRDLWTRDYLPVCEARWEIEELNRPSSERTHVVPGSFDELESCIGECVSRINKDRAGNKLHPILVVNSDKDMAKHSLDFNRTGVWRILVGGTKLARGFTVEGLTVSYYRRVSRTADTLMQMGRWFGFRRGYRDLVRLYLGEEPVGRGRNARLVDLYDEFGAVCLDEEHFREQLRVYAGERTAAEELLTPLRMPAFVASHSDFLTPTAKNKMQQVELLQENFGGRWVEKTMLPSMKKSEKPSVKHNRTEFEKLFKTLTWATHNWDLTPGDWVTQTPRGHKVSKGVRSKGAAHFAETTPARMERLLKSIQWRDGSKDPLARLCRFLAGRNAKKGIGDPAIVRWLIIAPQVDSRAEGVWQVGSISFNRVHRARLGDPERFKAFTERRHRQLAEFIAGLRTCDDPDDSIGQYRKKGTAVLLCYPVVEVKPVKGGPDRQDQIESMGHAILCPTNNIQRRLVFGRQQH